MVVKGYSFTLARITIVENSRPICQACHKPIKGAKDGALFHKRNENKSCHSVYLKFKALTKQGLTITEALAMLRD
jgi:hypothetical protein